MAQTKQKTKSKAKRSNYTNYAPGTVILPKKHSRLTRAFIGGCLALGAIMVWGAVATIVNPSVGSEDDPGTGLLLMLALLFWLILMLVRIKKVSRSENIFRIKVMLATIAVVFFCFILANGR